jgi:hypothetical protein
MVVREGGEDDEEAIEATSLYCDDSNPGTGIEGGDRDVS